MQVLDRHTEADAGLLDRLAGLARAAGAASLAAEAEALDARLSAGRLFVACVGQFKRGKSTLLNALVGERVLPVGVQPVTSVVTILRYGAARTARIAFAGGGSRDVPIDTLPAYVTEAGNPGNARHVTAAEVFLPAPILRSGLCLVDTPGVGSVFTDNTEVTRRFVPHVDAALVVLGADPPISADELQLACDIAREAPALVFVMAKADRLDDADVFEARAFTERVLADRVDMPTSPLLIVSAAERVSEGRPTRDWARLEDRLGRLGSTERAAVLQARHARGVARLAAELLVQIAEERRILEQPLEDAERRVGALAEWTSRADLALRELSYRFTAEVERFGQELERARTQFLSRAGAAATLALDRFIDGSTATRLRLRERAFAEAHDLAKREVEAWHRQIDPEADAGFRALTTRLVGLANGFLDSLSAVEPALGALPPLDPEWGLDERRRFYFNSLWTLASPSLSRCMLYLALPSPSGRALARRDARARLRRLLETNTFRVAGDLRDRAVEARRRLEGELRRRLEALHQAGTRALDRARIARAEGRMRLERELTQMRDLEAGVQSVLSQAGANASSDAGEPPA